MSQQELPNRRVPSKEQALSVPPPDVTAGLHELKTWPDYFRALLDGSKTFEYRRDDRGFKVGDTLHLREWEPTFERYTGREMRRRVSYILPVSTTFVVMALQSPADHSADLQRLREEIEAEKRVAQKNARIESILRDDLREAFNRRQAAESQVQQLQEENARLKALHDAQYEDAMIAHRWFSQVFGDEMNGRDFAVKCSMAEERLTRGASRRAGPPGRDERQR